MKDKLYLRFYREFVMVQEFSWNMPGHRCMTVTISKESIICMNLIVEADPDGCTKSTDGFRTMDVPAISWKMAILLYGFIPVS